MTIRRGDDMTMTQTQARRPRAWFAALGLVLVALLALAGCSGGNDSGDAAGGFVDDAESAPDVAAEGSASDAGGGDASVSSAEAPALVDRSVIYMVDLTVEVDDVAAASDQAAAIATRFGGFVQSESTFGLRPEPLPVEPSQGPASADIAPYPPGEQQAVVVIRVPADRYEQATDELEAIGQTLSRNRNAQDVTDEVVDVEARIETQQASIDRLQTLLGEATRIQDILAIETELTSRIAELESLQARLEQLSSLTDLATITVTFVPPETVVEQGSGFVAGLKAGWDAFVRTIEVGLTVLGAVLPFVVALALLLVPVVVWAVVHRRRRRSPGTPPTEPPTASTMSGASQDG